MEIKPGAKIQKPVITQAECDAYSAVVDAIIQGRGRRYLLWIFLEKTSVS